MYLTLIETITRLESARTLQVPVEQAVQTVRHQLALVAHYETYLMANYKFSPHFWTWVLGGQDKSGHKYPDGVVIRDESEAITEQYVSEFALEMHEQVLDQRRLYSVYGHAVVDPIVWGDFFIGKNAALAGMLRKKGLGLWGCRTAYQRLKKYAVELDSLRVQAILTHQPDLFAEEEGHWPANPAKCFPWRPLPIYRPWLLDVSPPVRDAYRECPGVRALEVRAVGYMGKVLSTAAVQLKDLGMV